jgi:hypothetical protein
VVYVMAISFVLLILKMLVTSSSIRLMALLAIIMSRSEEDKCIKPYSDTKTVNKCRNRQG